MDSPAISAVIITLNEERNLERCLRSLTGVVQEVVILDSHSTDGTEAIARAFGARFIQTEWLGYSATKNKANALASNDLILSLDADECLSPELIQALRELRPATDTVYSFARLTRYCGQWIRHAGWYPDVKARLFDRRIAQWEGSHVHEYLRFPSETNVIRIQGDLLHYSYDSKEEHVERLKKYTRLAVERDGKPSGGALAAGLAVLVKFLQMYLFKGGFRDGRIGWQLCRISAMGKWWAYRMA